MTALLLERELTVTEALALCRTLDRPMTCVCGCGVKWHTAPESDPCCVGCAGYRYAGGR